jgi:hypothetical protein
MTMPVTQCLIKLHEAHHNLEDYQGGVPRWQRLWRQCDPRRRAAAVPRRDLAPERMVRVRNGCCRASRTT